MLHFDFSLKFNAPAAKRWLELATQGVIRNLSHIILETARANLSAGEYAEVEQILHASLLSLAERGLYEGEVTSDHWQSWLAEWGSGSLMDTSNPDLQEYMASRHWNPSRNGHAISGRPAGAYEGLDGETHVSSGKLEGVNLEELAANDPAFQSWLDQMGFPDGAFLPRRPLHFMREAILSNQKLIIDHFNVILETFPIAEFWI